MTEALLSVNKGEQIYKCLNSEWLVDDNGPVMFRFISKLRADGKIELVFFTQRQDNRKHILQHISFAPEDFLAVVQTIRQTVWQFFPGAKLETVDFKDLSPSSYTALPVGRLSMLFMRLRWRAGGLFNKWRWFFLRRPPKY